MAKKCSNLNLLVRTNVDIFIPFLSIKFLNLRKFIVSNVDEKQLPENLQKDFAATDATFSVTLLPLSVPKEECRRSACAPVVVAAQRTLKYRLSRKIDAKS